jgi:hypothetical protein
MILPMPGGLLYRFMIGLFIHGDRPYLLLRRPHVRMVVAYNAYP